MTSTTRFVLATLTFVVASAGTILGISACNSGGGDVVSACTGYCQHFASCEGVSSSQIDNACKQSCADAGSVPPSACGEGGAAAVTNLYNCLEALPCNDLMGGDAGATPFLNCAKQAGCL